MAANWKNVKIEMARYLFLVAGLFTMSLGLVLMIQTNLGVAPWDVFHLGVYQRLGFLTRGQVIQGTGFFLVAVSWFLGVRPHVGTVLNMFFVGFFVDFIFFLDVIHIQGGLVLRLAALLAGACLMGFGSATYMTARRGSGPRDSLMVALSRRTRLSMGLVRTYMEVGVTLTGILLGGPFGVGTFIFALTIGFFLQAGFKFYDFFKTTPLCRGLLARLDPRGRGLDRRAFHA